MLQSCMSKCVLSVCMCCLCDVSAICTMFTIYTRKARARGRQSPHRSKHVGLFIKSVLSDFSVT